MAAIFTGSTTSYDGSGAPITGSGVVNVDFLVDVENASTLKIWIRKTGSGLAFKNPEGWSWSKPTIFNFNADGWDYYYTWTPISEASPTASLNG